MELMKKISLKLFLFVALVFAVNLLYKSTLWSGDKQKYAGSLDSLMNMTNNTDVLYLACSSNVSNSKEEKQTKGISSISGFIGSQYPELNINDISVGAIHANVFVSILENIKESSSIKTIVVSVNMRSFGGDWIYSYLESAIEQSILVMNDKIPPVFRRFLLSLDWYDNKNVKEREAQFLEYWKLDTIKIPEYNVKLTTHQWDSVVANSDRYKNIKGQFDYNKIKFATEIVKSYAYTLDTSKNIRFKQFDKLIEIANEKNIKLVFNILPENLDKIELMIGAELPFLIKRNRDILKEYYKNKGVILVDNLEALNNNYFYENYPTEHYTIKGKEIIANEVAIKMRDYYSTEKFIEKEIVPDENINKVVKLIQQKEYITLNKNKPYGINTYLNSIDIFKSELDSITLSYESLQFVNNDSILLVVQYYNDTNIFYWEKYNLNTFAKEGNIYSKEIKFPEIIDSNDTIRMFLWNNSSVDFSYKNLMLVRNKE